MINDSFRGVKLLWNVIFYSMHVVIWQDADFLICFAETFPYVQAHCSFTVGTVVPFMCLLSLRDRFIYQNHNY
jgi:hypothetical protein